MKKIAIYGAKALALGMYEAIHFLCPDEPCIGFIVSSLANNPKTLSGQKVWELKELKGQFTPEERNNIQILIATPEDIHPEITAYLSGNGFHNYVCMDSRKESRLMEQYFNQKGIFPSLHDLPHGNSKAKLCVYQAKFYKDRPLKQTNSLSSWVVPIQVGAALAEERVCKCCDNHGINISEKNVNYCEMTALYWIWKNQLISGDAWEHTDSTHVCNVHAKGMHAGPEY